MRWQSRTRPPTRGERLIVANVRGGGSGQPDAGYTVHLEEIFRDDLMGNDVGYAPQRFRVLSERRSRTCAPERVPIVRVRELEDAKLNTIAGVVPRCGPIRPTQFCVVQNQGLKGKQPDE